MLIKFQIIFVINLLVLKFGSTADAIKPRIVGGSPTTIDRHPYIVQLRAVNGGAFCGGTLITRKVVISAAHCVYNKDYQKIEIVGGTSKVNGIGVTRRIAKVTIHPEYKPDDFVSDLAVIEMRKQMVGTNIKPIPLCGAPLQAGAVLKVSGWGTLSENARGVPVQLQTVNLRVSPMATCKREFGRMARKNVFCTSGAQAKGHCYGDSGGPAVFNNQLCGVVSFGRKCGMIGYQSAYASIYPLRSFITRVIPRSRNY